MTDREKVIRGLECLITNKVDCDGCPYNEGENSSCLKNIAKDALELLKEQEPIQVKVSEDYVSIKIGECPKCKSFINNRTYPKSCGCGQRVKWDE